MTMSYHTESDIALRAAIAAGTYLKEIFSSHREEILKGAVHIGKDIKIEADRGAELRILELLQEESPHAVLAEESGTHGSANLEGEDPVWIVDPLDGTFNYSRGYPSCCVSIGLFHHGQAVLGVIYDFFAEEIFRGIIGEGAFLNDLPIAVASTGDLSEAALAADFTQNRDYAEEAMLDFLQKILLFKKIRMTGSVALSLAYLAAGRVDVCLEEEVMLWDAAAGLAIVKAAGGHIQIEKSKRSQWRCNILCAARAYPELFPPQL